MKSKIVSLSKNEEFKSILSGKKISNKYVRLVINKRENTQKKMKLMLNKLSE